MAAVRHLEAIPDHDPRVGPRRHLRLVEPVPGAQSVRRRRAATYRRRRLVVGVVVMLVVVTGTRSLSSPETSSGAAAPAQAGAPVIHVVQPGDSYWSIASALDRPGDIRATVDALSEANDGRALQVGDRISLAG